MTVDAVDATFVVTSELRVPNGGEGALETAFRNRLRAVDAWPGFQRLEVWRDARVEGGYLLVTWWCTPDAYRAYMRSGDHRDSHARVPTGQFAPAAVAVRRYTVVTE